MFPFFFFANDVLSDDYTSHTPRSHAHVGGVAEKRNGGLRVLCCVLGWDVEISVMRRCVVCCCGCLFAVGEDCWCVNFFPVVPGFCCVSAFPLFSQHTHTPKRAHVHLMTTP